MWVVHAFKPPHMTASNQRSHVTLLETQAGQLARLQPSRLGWNLLVCAIGSGVHCSGGLRGELLPLGALSGSAKRLAQALVKVLVV
jgi:hypothetical protein